MEKEKSYHGHRQRLRGRFYQGGLDGFHDYEIVEMLLTLGSPRVDCKPPAKAAIKRFHDLRGVLEATAEELQEIDSIGPSGAFAIKLVHEVARRFLKERIIDRPALSSAQDVLDYLYHSMRDLKKERFRVIYLNSQNQIIDAADVSEGTVNASTVHVREVIEGALKHGAVSMIFVHNHPSGSPQPSRSDIAITRDLVFAAKVMELKVLDHIIIGDNAHYSFAADGLIEKYELQFLRLGSRESPPGGKRAI